MIQLIKNQPKRGIAFDGFAVITFVPPEKKGSVQGKMKQGFRLGKCFILSNNDIAEISGTFHSDELKV